MKGNEQLFGIKQNCNSWRTDSGQNPECPDYRIKAKGFL